MNDVVNSNYYDINDFIILSFNEPSSLGSSLFIKWPPNRLVLLGKFPFPKNVQFFLSQDKFMLTCLAGL